MDTLSPNVIMTKNGTKIAYHKLEGRSPGIIFLGGFMSDMTGTKASFFEEFCREQGRAYIRFDYSGHGVSSGKFEEGTISTWTEDTLEVIDQLSRDQQILIGSSMGGWVMVLAALQRKARIVGLMGIAAAPDFVESLIWNKLTAQQKDEIQTKGICYIPAEGYDKPYPITKKFIEDGRQQTILNKPIDLLCPIRLVHGVDDTEVPWEFSQKLMNACISNNATLTLLKKGDHRLSKPHELDILGNTLNALLGTTSKGDR